MVSMAKRRPWLCREDSTAIAPIALVRKHESRIADVSGDLTPSNNGASSKKEEKKKKKKKKKKESVLSLLSARAPTSWVLSRRKAPACTGDGRTAEKTKEVSFNLGFGAGLIFLYAKSATEVHRMMELRAEMESLLKQIRGVIPTSGGISSSASTNNLQEPIELQSAADSVYAVDHQLACSERSHEESSDQHMNSVDAESHIMEQLEAELESELERLQLNLESDGSVTPCWEVEVVGVSSGTSRTDSESFETDDSRGDNVNNLRLTCENGVCPRELERRLYKLLVSRHQKKTAELESALEEANRKLHEKEKEIRQWRDTNRLMLDAGRDGP